MEKIAKVIKAKTEGNKAELEEALEVAKQEQRKMYTACGELQGLSPYCYDLLLQRTEDVDVDIFNAMTAISACSHR